MEPRPNKPARGAAKTPPDASTPSSSQAPIYAGNESASWATSAWASPSNPGPTRAEPTPPQEPLTARAADWHGQPGAYAPGNDGGYSPGPSLAPIDQRRGASWLGPLVAVAVLALIVAAVAVAFTKVRGGGDNRDAPTRTAQVAAPAQTSAALAAASAAAQTQVTPTAPAPAATLTTSAAVKPADTPKPAATTPPGSGSSGSSSSGTVSNAAAKTLLPTIDDVGSEFVMTEFDDRNRTAVSKSFGDPNDALSKLKQWGWKENVYTTFEIPADNVADPSQTTYLSVSIHRFATIDGATQGFTYFSDAVLNVPGTTEQTSDNYADQTRTLSSTSATGNLVVIYIRQGNYLIKATAASPTGDPTAELVALVKKIVK